MEVLIPLAIALAIIVTLIVRAVRKPQPAGEVYEAPWEVCAECGDSLEDTCSDCGYAADVCANAAVNPVAGCVTAGCKANRRDTVKAAAVTNPGIPPIVGKVG